MKNTLLQITITFIIGIMVGSVIDISPGILLLFCFFLVMLVFYWMGQGKQVTWLLFLLVALGGILRYQLLWQQQSSLEQFRNREVVVTGVVLQEPDLLDGRLQFTMQVETIKDLEQYFSLREKVLVQVGGLTEGEVTYGEKLQLQGKLVSPLSPANFQRHDYAVYLRRQGIKMILLSQGRENITVLAQGQGNRCIHLALQFRKRFIDVVENMLPAPQAQVLAGFLFGERGALTPELLLQIERSGVMHLFAVSGLHVGYVAALGYGLGKLCNWSPRWTIIISGLFAGIYLLLVGFRASVYRAGIMLWIGILALLVYRRLNGLTALSAAAFVLLWFQPGLLFTSGFQLSFAATWGIIYLFSHIVRLLLSLPRWLAFPLAVSIAAQLATWPLVAYHFYGIPLGAVLVNLPAVPLVGLIVMLGLIGCTVGLIFLPFAKIMGLAIYLLINLFLDLVRFSANLPWAYLNTAPPTWSFMLFYYILLIASPLLFRRDNRYKLKGQAPLMVVASFMLLVLLWVIPLWRPAQFEVTFLSVGAGDGIVVTLPGGRTLLIDTGPGGGEGQYDSGANVIVPYLRQAGIKQIELVLLTHPHQDHWGGLNSVITNLSVRGIAYPLVFTFGDFGITQGESIPLYQLKAGDSLLLGEDISLKVLHPSSETSLLSTESDVNNNSLVLYLVWNEVSFLFTGDLEAEGEVLMLRENLVPKATVLKVGHHGANTSSTERFLQQVSPKVAVISTGPSTFGHPHQETLDRLEQVGAVVYRTDRDGAVKIRTDGHRLWVESAR
jgi:competence protein ComEC